MARGVAEPIKERAQCVVTCAPGRYLGAGCPLRRQAIGYLQDLVEAQQPWISQVVGVGQLFYRPVETDGNTEQAVTGDHPVITVGVDRAARAVGWRREYR